MVQRRGAAGRAGVRALIDGTDACGKQLPRGDVRAGSTRWSMTAGTCWRWAGAGVGGVRAGRVVRGWGEGWERAQLGACTAGGVHSWGRAQLGAWLRGMNE